MKNANANSARGGLDDRMENGRGYFDFYGN